MVCVCFLYEMVATSVRGVMFNPNCKTRPYYFVTQADGKKKQWYFATLNEAAEAKEAKDAAKLAPKIAKRAALKEKRARDLLMKGNSCKQERDVAMEMQTCADAAYGPGTVLVMNDGTRADLLFKRDGGYLQLQLKTTKTTLKGRTNGYLFQGVLGYAGMLVVCWVIDLQRAWVFDGTWLHARGKKCIFLTPGNPSETAALKGNLSMLELVTYLHDVTPAAHVRLTTEDAARNDFQGCWNKQEKMGIDAYEILRPADYQWPREQNGEYDRARIDDDRVVRIQHKSCAPHGIRAGLHCHFGKSDGHDDDGKRIYRCYDKDDADLFVFRYYDASTNTSHFWEIPSEVLAQHGYFTNAFGRESITLHGPVGKQPNPNAKYKADTWTRAFYAGALKHT